MDYMPNGILNYINFSLNVNIKNYLAPWNASFLPGYLPGLKA